MAQLVADGANEVQLRGISHTGLLAGFSLFNGCMDSDCALALTSSLTNVSNGQKVWGRVYKSSHANTCLQWIYSSANIGLTRCRGHTDLKNGLPALKSSPSPGLVPVSD